LAVSPLTMSTVERSRGGRHLLTVAWPSAAGQVAAISGFLDLRGCYIVEFAQFDDELAHRFFARVVYRTDPAWTPSLARMRDAFQSTAAHFGPDWEMHDLATRPRVLIMVSKFDHCLNDLLYRHA
jgi:formyltetrahydrofolate deformylase